MKRIILTLTIIAIGLSAQAQQIRDIKTEVWLFRNRNAFVVQTWDLEVTGGTEWYIPVGNMGESSIRDFCVWENDEEFENDGDNWDSSRSMEQKAGRCGIVQKGGGDIELCWGLGSYGNHVFTIMYIIDNLVQNYNECDGFHWHFLNDEWSVKPQHASITFINETDGDPWYWNDEEDCNVRFWGFGMIGDSRIEDGVICFESTEPFQYKSFFSALMSFDKGLFSPREKSSGSFEKLKKKAMKGSDYNKKSMEEILGRILGIGILLVIAFFILAVIFMILQRLYWRITGNRYDKKMFGKTKIDGWWRDVPLQGSPTAMWSLFQLGDHLAPDSKKTFSNLVSAYFLKWIQDGLLRVERDPQNTDRVNLLFVNGNEEVAFEDSMEKTVYEAARTAAGDNLLLEKNEFKKWSYKNDSIVVGWPDVAMRVGQARLGDFRAEDLCHAVEFKNFLNDFTVLDQREAPEVKLWKQFMVLAASLGIADKVAKNFEKLFPKMMEEYTRDSNMMDTATTYLILNDLTSSSKAMVASAVTRDENRKAAEAAARRRSSGGGGSISFGGGGGGFGGGHGGGAR